MSAAFRPGSVVRYAPDPSRHDPRWCREGFAIADDRGVLFDTYWMSGNDAHRLLPVEIATAEVRFHLDDYDELDRYGRGSWETWSTFHPVDRERVTSQHGLQVRYFVRKGAAPDAATRIANAEEKVRAAEEELRSAEGRLLWQRDDLAALVASMGAKS